MANSELLSALLQKRGITDENQVDIFLNPSYERDFHDPFLMRDMEKACKRLFKAIEHNEKIVIYADYDCDGIPGAVILSDFFKKIDYKNYEVYIPQRNSEGYGLNLDAIRQFAEKEVKLVITIDLGITAVDEVAEANKNGIDVIITDHHLPHEILPDACAILNPKVDNYPEKMLCGAGVMFKFIQGLISEDSRNFLSSKENQIASLEKLREANLGFEKWMLDMAGLATLSDMVPLTGENRAIAYFGMKVLKKSPRPGLQKLLSIMKIDQRYLSEDDIGFMLTPRLNAASRMDDPRRAFELLSATDPVEAGVLANHLSKINDERKNIVKSIMREINKKFENREPSEVIVVGNPEWRIGVLGLVAGKIMDEYDKPVFVWGKDENDCIKGSCRSPGSVSVVELMTATSEVFVEYGGHELAGGFTVHHDQVHFMEEILSNNFLKIKKESSLGVASVDHDVESDLAVVNKKNWKEISKMSPFGFGNPKPVFLFPDVKIEKIKKFGKNGSGEHIELVVSDVNKNQATAIAFFSSPDSFAIPLEVGKHINLLATFDLSRFRGKEELRLRIEDIH